MANHPTLNLMNNGIINRINDNNICQNNILKQILKSKKNKNKEDKDKYISNHNIFEINTLEYNLAILHDKRACYEYYFSLIKIKHPIYFAFCPINDFNSRIIKLDLFFLSFSVFYAINFAFFDEKMIHKIYEDKGKYDIIYFLPKITISFLATHIISIILKYIFLSERNIITIKHQSTYTQMTYISENVIKRLLIKYTLFYVLSIIFLVFFWLLLSSFGAVYQNTQIFVIKNTCISFAMNLIYPLFFNIIPCIFRMISLSSKSNYLYNFSKFLQII